MMNATPTERRPQFDARRPDVRQRFRAVWLSDIHLGFRGCNAELLLDFLHATECDVLYLVGDIVDLWQIGRRPFWPQQHNDVVRSILGKAKYGTRVVYVLGNHDAALSPYLGHAFGNIALVERAIHTRLGGERLLVLHGDQFDAVVATSRWLGVLGSQAYSALLLANRVLNTVRRHCGFPYWSLAGFLKYKVKNAIQYIGRFEQAVVAEAVRAAVDGVVCGHIHRPEITRLGSIAYHNCGDWVENCTALVEHTDGHMALLYWADAVTARPALAAAAA